MKTPTKKPGSPLDAIYRRVDLSAEQIFQALSRLRREAEQQVEFLIELIDTIDGDADLEPIDDREDDCEDEGAFDDNGIADLDGLMEQCPAMFEGFEQRVLA